MKSGLFQAEETKSGGDSRPTHSYTDTEKQILRFAQNDKIGIIRGAHRLATALIGLLILSPSVVYSQVASTPGAQAQATVAAPKRLSDWLLEQPADANAYPLGLSWRVPGEVAAQSELRLELLNGLSGLDREVKVDPEVLGRLRDWGRTLPVTGRVPVAVPDARWLQANPARDPMLQPGQSAVLPKRPRTVTVITARGKRCSVAHSAGHEAIAYVQACSPASSRRADWAWVAQPDGRVQRFGVAAWNREKQDEPAPGAWIWAPPRDGGFPERLSQQLITFLATQGPAPDIGADISVSNAGTGISVSNAGTEPKARMNAPQPAPGGASEAWTPSGLPELGGTAAGLRDRKGLTEGGASDSDTTAVLPPPSLALSSRSRSIETTASDFGGIGLLQTPSARMEKAGHFSVNFSRMYPYLQSNIMVQPFDWLEAGFRYTNISNRLYSADPSFSANQSYKDKSLDAKFRLWSESAYVPEVALGLRDVAGTGLFSGEYLVASKRTGAFDWNLGQIGRAS